MPQGPQHDDDETAVPRMGQIELVPMHPQVIEGIAIEEPSAPHADSGYGVSAVLPGSSACRFRRDDVLSCAQTVHTAKLSEIEYPQFDHGP